MPAMAKDKFQKFLHWTRAGGYKDFSPKIAGKCMPSSAPSALVNEHLQLLANGMGQQQNQTLTPG